MNKVVFENTYLSEDRLVTAGAGAGAGTGAGTATNFIGKSRRKVRMVRRVLG